jgi:hypothetical protein
MSSIKEAAIKMIQEIPDDQVVHILHIVKGVNGLNKNFSVPSESKKNALMHIQQFRGKIPADLNYSEELAASRAQRYADTN